MSSYPDSITSSSRSSLPSSMLPLSSCDFEEEALSWSVGPMTPTSFDTEFWEEWEQAMYDIWLWKCEKHGVVDWDSFFGDEEEEEEEEEEAIDVIEANWKDARSTQVAQKERGMRRQYRFEWIQKKKKKQRQLHKKKMVHHQRARCHRDDERVDDDYVIMK